MICKIIMSIVFTLLTIISLFSGFHNLNIDSTTIILSILIFFPWILDCLDEIEIKGVGKFKVREEEKSQ